MIRVPFSSFVADPWSLLSGDSTGKVIGPVYEMGSGGAWGDMGVAAGPNQMPWHQRAWNWTASSAASAWNWTSNAVSSAWNWTKRTAASLAGRGVQTLAEAPGTVLAAARQSRETIAHVWNDASSLAAGQRDWADVAAGWLPDETRTWLGSQSEERFADLYNGAFNHVPGYTWFRTTVLGQEEYHNSFAYAAGGAAATEFDRAWLGQVYTGWFNQTQNFAAGWGDTMSFGLTRMGRQVARYDDVVNSTSTAYNVGVVVGTVHQAALRNPWGVAYGFSTLTVNFADSQIQQSVAAGEEAPTWARGLRLVGNVGQIVTSVRGLPSSRGIGDLLAWPGGFARGLVGDRALVATGYTLGVGIPAYSYTSAVWQDVTREDGPRMGLFDHLDHLVPALAGLGASTFRYRQPPQPIADRMGRGQAAGQHTQQVIGNWSRNAAGPAANLARSVVLSAAASFPTVPAVPPRGPIPVRAQASIARPTGPTANNLQRSLAEFMDEVGAFHAGRNAPASGAGSKPAWLRRLEEGNAFNRSQATRYPHNEVYIERPNGGPHVRVDSYNPRTGEVVSRKHTQFANIQESTGVGYVNELAGNYPPGARIANVPTQAAGSGHANAGLAGQQLRGTMILEVPVQNGPIPQAVIDAANRQGIIIRDINGRVYNP